MHTSKADALSYWDICRTEGEGGTGNWRALRRSVEELAAAASVWQAALGAVQKPWLCWNMNDDWCLLQQKLILEVGWTPVVGWDPNSAIKGPGRLASGALAIDFNRDLKMPVLFPHVPIELMFMWADRLAFWHADLLLPLPKMRQAATWFDKLSVSETAAVFSTSGLRNIFRRRQHRFWEVLGCTTKQASADMFKHGAGWWRQWSSNHVNLPESASLRTRRSAYNWDHGGGVLYWERECGGKVKRISEGFVSEGHFSVTSRKNYIRASSKSEEMDLNFDLEDIARRFGLTELLSAR